MMPSSTTSSEPRPDDARQLEADAWPTVELVELRGGGGSLRLFAVAAVLLLALPAAFTLGVHTTHPEGAPPARDDWLGWKLYREALRGELDAVVIGSSRAQTIDASYIDGVDAGAWFNWWIPDLSAPETAHLVERAVGRGVGHVVLVVDPEALLIDRPGPAAGAAETRLLQALDAADAADAAFPRDILAPWRQASIRSAWRAIGGAEGIPPADMAANGTRPPSPPEDPQTALGRIAKDGIIKLAGLYPRDQNTPPHAGTVAWMNATLDALAGADATILVTPLHPAARERVAHDEDFWDLRRLIHEAVLDRCRDGWHFLDASRVEDFLAPGEAEPGPMGFRDAWHFDYGAARILVQEAQRPQHACPVPPARL